MQTKGFRVRTFLAALVLALLTITIVSAQQIDNTPPDYPIGPAYNFCQAKAHSHSPIYTTTLYFRAYGRQESKCSTNIIGNILHLYYWSYGYTFWYDWDADPNAETKLSVWANNPGEPITVRYCHTCKLALTATSPRVPE